MNKFGKYAPIVVQILITILVLNHWYRGLHYEPLLVMWCILLGLSISPILDLIYGNTDDECDFWVQEDECPHNEPLHNHHDGCPACYSQYVDDKIQQEADDYYEGVNR